MSTATAVYMADSMSRTTGRRRDMHSAGRCVNMATLAPPTETAGPRRTGLLGQVPEKLEVLDAKVVLAQASRGLHAQRSPHPHPPTSRRGSK